MKRTLFFILLSLIFSQVLHGQVIIPGELPHTSDIERQIIRVVNQGGEVSPFMMQLSANYTLDEAPETYEREYNDYVSHLASRREKLSERDFLSYLFFRTHKVYLKNYQNHSSFSQLMDKGKYDCLTGTILYSLLLSEFGFNFTVVETDYHIYLVVHTGNARVMFEATDPRNGFLDEEEIIMKKTAEINNRNSILSERYITLQSNPRKFSDLEKLMALQYYNASVLAYNSEDLIASIDQLEKACIYDDSDRFKNFGKLLAKSLVNSGTMDQETKTGYLMKLTRFLNGENLSASL